MPNLVIYIPAAIWRKLEQKEGKAAAKHVARVIANDALVKYAAREEEE